MVPEIVPTRFKDSISKPIIDASEESFSSSEHATNRPKNKTPSISLLAILIA